MFSSSVHIFCNIQLAPVKSRNSLKVRFVSFISITLLHTPESTYTFVTKQLRSLNAIDGNGMSFFGGGGGVCLFFFCLFVFFVFVFMKVFQFNNVLDFK